MPHRLRFLVLYPVMLLWSGNPASAQAQQPSPAVEQFVRVRSPTVILAHKMQMERQFVAAGGLLLAGPDPTGNGGVLPGFGDQREIELLVEAGFTPVEAIRIATLNGAIYEGKQGSIGSIEVGKNADLIVIKGDPSQQIADIENVEIVFKDGIGYDSANLLRSVAGRHGQY